MSQSSLTQDSIPSSQMSQDCLTPDSVHGRKKSKRRKKKGKNSGRTQLDSTTFDNAIFCEPCKNVSGTQIAVETFCVNCCEYLCKSCSDYHAKLAATKQHVLQDKACMPKDKSKIKDKKLDKCSLHSDYFIEYFCRSCDQTGCHVCITLDHRTCKNVDYISNIATNLEESMEFGELNSKLELVTAQLKNAGDILKFNECKKDHLRESANKAVKQQKDEVTKILHDWEHDVLETIEEKDKENEGKLQLVSKQLNNLTSDLKVMTSDLEKRKETGDLCQMFIGMKKCQKNLVKLMNECQILQLENKVYSYKFSESKQVFDKLKKSNVFGELTKLNSEQKRKITYRKTISVQSKEEKYTTCAYSASVITTDILVVVSNGFLKVINSKTGEILFILNIPGLPVSITKTAEREIAVTIKHEKKVTFFSVAESGHLKMKREFGVDGTCYGIAHTDGKLILTFHGPSKIEIVDIKGTVLKSFRQDMDQYKCLKYPSNVAVGRCLNRDVFYVSDNMEDTITCMTLDSRILAIYKDEHLREPWQMAVDENGSIFVCCGLSANIHQLSEDCVKVQVLREWGPGSSCGLDYCKQSKKLYIGRLVGNNLNVYDLD